MKILHIIRALEPGGLERVVRELGQGLRRNGHECHLACLHVPGAWYSSSEWDGLWCGESGGLIRQALTLSSYVRHNRIDVIHSHNPAPHKLAVIVHLLTGVPLVHTKHGRNYPGRQRRVILNRLLAAFSNKIVAVSQSAADVARNVEKVPAGKIVIIPNGVDVAHFTACGYGGEGEPVVFGTVGRLAPEKNYAMLVEGVLKAESRKQKTEICNHPSSFLRNFRLRCASPRQDAAGLPAGTLKDRVGSSKNPSQSHSVPALRPVLRSSQSVVGSLGEAGSSVHSSDGIAGTSGRKSPKGLQSVVCSLQSSPSTLLLVGDGPKRNRLEEKARELGMGERVEFAGMQDDPRPFYARMDVFCLSSETEGMPMTLLEAGACGLPAVVTDAGGCAEVVEDGVTGLVVPRGDVDAFAAALAKLAADAELRRRMGAAARERIVREFSLERMTEAYLRVYGEVAR